MSTSGHKIFEYTILLVGMFIFSVLFYVYRYDKNSLLIISSLGALSYTSWGMLHHFLEKRLTVETALEYILIGFFVFLLVLNTLSV